MSHEEPRDQCRVDRRPGADHHSARPPREHLGDGRLGHEGAADLDEEPLPRVREEAPRQLAVVTGSEGAVEIDKVHPAGSGARELARQGERVSSSGTRDAPALDVNGGIKLHDWEGN